MAASPSSVTHASAATTTGFVADSLTTRAKELRPLVEQSREADRHLGQDFRRWSCGRDPEQRLQWRHEAISLEDRAEQLFLRAEVVVGEAMSGACRGRDVGDRRCAKPAFREQPEGDVEEFGSATIGLAGPASSRQWTSGSHLFHDVAH